MTLSAKVDLTVNPPVLTVVSDKRKVSVQVTAVGETVTATGLFPVTVTDSSGKAWKAVSDDGTTATFS
jgi:predicted methyltransferase